jgi:hypothetical protein
MQPQANSIQEHSGKKVVETLRFNNIEPKHAVVISLHRTRERSYL